ncbi:hypothetical protein [Actinomadura fibrosa]|uniref:Copper chaperone PCu(A)C n=1 Tax=Actinomadura fibrosa TaxID=111802 RepID=A0ABW2Y153_9ACTN|nr:hypothetical protein [Actinomadura fibrosa]
MIRNSRRVVALAVAGAVATAPVISGCGAGSTPQTAAPTQLTEGVNASVPRDRPEAPQLDIRNMFLLGPKPDTVFRQGSSLPLYAMIINHAKSEDRLVSISSPSFAQAKISGGGLALPAAQPNGVGSAVRLEGAAGQASPGAPVSETPGKKSEKPSADKSKSPSASPSGEASSEVSEKPSSGATPQPTGQGATPNTSSTPESSNTPSAPATGSPVPVAPGSKTPLVVLSGLNREIYGGERVQLRLQFQNAGSVDLSVPVVPQQGEYAGFTAVSAGTPVQPGSPSPAEPSGSAPSESASPGAGSESPSQETSETPAGGAPTTPGG